MLVSGHGYPETPKTLNAKLKSRGGYVDAAIIWGAVTSIYPGIAYRSLVLCRDTDAPLSKIDASIAVGQPVVVEVDSSPRRGLQTHWVVLYAKKGRDYLMLDPWPHPTESCQEVLLMDRYSHGKPLKKSITAVVFYECVQSGSGDSGDAAPTTPTTPDEPGTYVKIPVTVDAGLRLRSGPTTASATVTIEPPGALMLVIEPVEVATPKIGVYGQWIHVRDSQGREGYVAAWYVEAGPVVTPVDDGGETGGADEPPVPVPTEPEEPEQPAEPEPSVPVPDEPVEPEPEPVPTPEALTIFVSQSVGEGGLRLRNKPGVGGAVVAIEKAGTALTPLETVKKVRNKIGRRGKWLHVSDPKRQQGYVSARYVELEAPPTDETPPAPVPTEPVSDSEVETTTESLTVYVSSAASAGLRMRSGPTTSSSTLKVIPMGTKLTVLEGTKDIVGDYNKWLKVRDPEGDDGYVAAWYVHQ
jgi:SH3-like domain-containing protein